MKQEDVESAVRVTAFDNNLTHDAVVIVVYQFLTMLIGKAPYFPRQFLRTVRGMVKTYADKQGIKIPITGG